MDALTDGLAGAPARQGVPARERGALMQSSRPESVHAVQAVWPLGAAVVRLSQA